MHILFLAQIHVYGHFVCILMKIFEIVLKYTNIKATANLFEKWSNHIEDNDVLITNFRADSLQDDINRVLSGVVENI